MIEIAVIAGLVGSWFWAVLNDDEGIAGPLHRLLSKNEFTKKWMECPLCSGAWFAIIPSLILFHDALLPALITAFAAACVSAIISTYFLGD